MKHLIRMSVIYLSCLLATGLGAQDSLPTLSESEESHFRMLVQGNNRFAFDLYQHMKQQTGNLYFSSYSIVSGLGMAAIGAKGETLQEFQRAFHYLPALLLFVGDLNASLQQASSKNVAQVLLANELWVDKSVPIQPSFKQTLMRDFRATLQPIDFANDLSQSIQKINQWVSQQTQGKVINMLSGQDVNTNTRMLLTTAAYLRGSWAVSFDQKLTKRLPFHITPQRTFMADMMQNTAHYLLSKGEQWDILVVPYRQGEQGAQLAMVIFLPKKEIPLATLEKNLTGDNWQQWKSNLQNQIVTLTMPRFRIDKRFDLETALRALGFNSIFRPDANFSQMTTEKGIYMNKILHKTSIRLDERGVDMGTAGEVKSIPPTTSETPYEFMADHPFVFMIWDQKTDSILFMGRVALP